MKHVTRLLVATMIFMMLLLGVTSCKKECSHQWGEWAVTKEASCTVAGTKVRQCTECEEIETSAIQALGHDWNDASCAAPKTCKNCYVTDGSALAHQDENCDHICDHQCGKNDMGSHVDSGTDKDHICDYGCGAVLENCADQNKDHVCDYGCNKVYGACEDANIDHVCDYGCGKAYGTCEDKNKDHSCDYGCKKTFGICEDGDKDHACDYGCGKVFGEHTDSDDANHACDYGCGRIADDGCYDTVVDGICDECGANFPHDCVDQDKNHACDICSADMGVHADENKDHNCDYGCNKKIGACEDENKDHVCDYGCEAVLGVCEDADFDHACDYGCKAEFGVCEDADFDHACDYGCKAEFGVCEDGDFDHACDYGCKKVLGACEDTNFDHECDHGCSKVFGEHSDLDTDGDHVCDYGCGATIESCSDVADDNDHNCDVCGNADITAHDYSEATCGAPATCSECGATTGSTLEHIDENRDHICDNGCGKNDIGAHADSDTDNNHICDYGCGVALGNCSDVETDKDHCCDICGQDNVTSHAHVENEALATAATCVRAATKTYVCNCGNTYTETCGDALGHDITDVTPWEESLGGCAYVLKYKCKREGCGATVEGETVYHHNYIARIDTPATCSAPGEKTFRCSACGNTDRAPEEIPADVTGHDWTVGTVENGKRTDICSICQTAKTVMISDSNSASSNASDLGNTDLELKVDENTSANIQLGEDVANAIGDKDITVSAGVVDENTLKGMGVTQSQLDQIGSNTVYDFTITDKNGENISDFGKENYVKITLPYTLAQGEDIDSIAVWFISDRCQLEDCDKGENCSDAHKLVSIKATYNNGFVTFWTDHFSYYTVTRLRPEERCALYGHNYTHQHVEGNCTKDTYDLYVCVRCHDKYIDEKTQVVADGHDYISETHEATCTENGYILYSCKDCDHSYRTKLNAGGHDWRVEDSLEASCEADGYTKLVCNNCNEEELIVYAKLDHVYTSTVVPVTCTADGYTLHDCDNCDWSYTDAYVDALGHDYGDGTWTWEANGNKAKLTLVCAHDGTHVTSLYVISTMDKQVEKGECSSYVIRTHTATVEYNGVTYTDVMIIRQGNPTHKFSAEWMKNETEHWHECICGAREDVAPHTFGETIITKEPTCAEAGETVSYCACGGVHVVEIPATGEHEYVDGFCVECGLEYVDTYYLNLVESWRNIDGFAITIRDFSYEMHERESSFLESFKFVNRIQQIDVAELMLYMEDGELGGAAHGSVTAFNNPIFNATVTYDFKAVISDGYVYIQLTENDDLTYFSKTRNIKMSVKAAILSVLEESMDINEEVLAILYDGITNVALPTWDIWSEANAEAVDAALAKVFAILFDFEQQLDGSYQATLNFDKVSELLENISDHSIAHNVDHYFGEGTFDDIVALAEEILNLEISEIPAYLDAHGFDSADLIQRINMFAVAKLGQPLDFDLNEIIHRAEYRGVTLKKYIFGDFSMGNQGNIFALIANISIGQLMDDPVEAIADIVVADVLNAFGLTNRELQDMFDFTIGELIDDPLATIGDINVADVLETLGVADPELLDLFDIIVRELIEDPVGVINSITVCDILEVLGVEEEMLDRFEGITIGDILEGSADAVADIQIIEILNSAGIDNVRFEDLFADKTVGMMQDLDQVFGDMRLMDILNLFFYADEWERLIADKTVGDIISFEERKISPFVLTDDVPVRDLFELFGIENEILYDWFDGICIGDLITMRHGELVIGAVDVLGEVRIAEVLSLFVVLDEDLEESLADITIRELIEDPVGAAGHINASDLLRNFGFADDRILALFDASIEELAEDFPEEIRDITIGEILNGFGIEILLSDPVNAIEDQLRRHSLFDLLKVSKYFKEDLEYIIDLVRDGISLSFVTDSQGQLLSIHLNADNFSEEIDGELFMLHFSLDLVVNAEIEVTWADIVKEIEDGFVPPSEIILETDVYDGYYNEGYSGYVSFNGEQYWYDDGIRFYAYIPDYDQLGMIIFNADCNGWTAYELYYAEMCYRFSWLPVVMDGEKVWLLVDEYGGAKAKLVSTETGFTAILEDGTEKEIAFAFSEINIRMEIKCFTEEVFLAVFENPGSGRCNWLGSYVDYYYNGELGEYAMSSQHEWQTEYEGHGENCREDGWTRHTTCQNCDYHEAYSGHWCPMESITIELSDYGACNGQIYVRRCMVCGQVDYYEIHDMDCTFGALEREDILDANGKVVGQKEIAVCSACGLVRETEQWREYHTTCEYTQHESYCLYFGEECILDFQGSYWYIDHRYEYTYELLGDTCEDGCKRYWACSACGKRDNYYVISYEHREEWLSVVFPDYTCGGDVEYVRCNICDQVTSYTEWGSGMNCDFYTVREDILDADGNVVGYKDVSTCYTCGLVREKEERKEYHTTCEYTLHESYCLYFGEECIFAYQGSNEHNEHQYEYTYELRGETCDDGYHIYGICIKCDSTYQSSGWGHRTEWKNLDLNEYGLCGGYIEEGYCYVCNTSPNCHFNYYCNWQLIDINAEGYYVYQCTYCNATRLYRSVAGEKNENCGHTHTVLNIYLVNDVEVLRHEYTYRDVCHCEETTFVMNGLSCTDGYTAITTCRDCDYRYEESGNSHTTYVVFETPLGMECCEEHYFYIHSCACGYNWQGYMDTNHFTYDEATGAYTCENCEWVLLYESNYVEEGCVLYPYLATTLTIAGEVVHRYERTTVYANHHFSDVECRVIDGNTVLCAVCDSCGTVKTIASESISVELEYHDGTYYYDYVVTPDETGTYVIMGLSDRDTYVTLYQMINGYLVQIGANDDGAGNQFLLSASLEAGVTYVYRIRFYDSYASGTIPFMLYQSTVSGEYACQHDDDMTDFAVLLEGSETCEDGVLYGTIYTACGCINNARVVTDHRTTTKEHIDLTQYGACYGEFVYNSCACGNNYSLSLNSCAHTYTTNSYYDEEGRLVHVETRTCSGCGLRYQKSYYTVRDHDNCTLTYYYTVVINVGGALVAEKEYTVVQAAHDYEAKGELLSGEGSSCGDGVIITHTCKDCGDSYNDTYYYHYTFEKEQIDLASLGSVCGGYATLNGCACGYNTSVNLDNCLCERDRQSCSFWIENAITQEQYQLHYGNAYRYSYSYNAYVYVCAVTDPEDAACAYRIRYATYWLPDENACVAYQYQTWQFGYNEETGTCAYEITFKTGSSKCYHHYVTDHGENSTKYDCALCGSYYYENRYYNENGNCTKYEKLLSNTLNNGYDRYYAFVEEYALRANGNSYTSHKYVERIYSDGNRYWEKYDYSYVDGYVYREEYENSDGVWYKEQSYEKDYVGTFGDSGREVFSSYESYNQSYTETTYAYVYYYGYQFRIFTHIVNGDTWERYDYTYSFDNGCVQTERYTNSDGADSVNESDICRLHSVVIQYPTCSQDGENCRECYICGKRQESYTVNPYDHSWSSGGGLGYYCTRCGLENANGASGDIVMEDMTYGNGEYYVVGYYARNNVEFTYYISLILADGEEIICEDIEYIALDGIRAYAFSIAAVDAWAAENGYTEYDVRFSFVPYGADGSFDYGLTFTKPVIVGAIVDSVTFTDFIGAGENKSYTIIPTEDGVWSFTSATDFDTYGYLYDANGNLLLSNDDGGEGNNFLITYALKAGETYIVKVRWYSSSQTGNMPLVFDFVPAVTE